MACEEFSRAKEMIVARTSVLLGPVPSGWEIGR